MEHQHNPVSNIDIILNWIYWCVQNFYSSLSIAQITKKLCFHCFKHQFNIF